MQMTSILPFRFVWGLTLCLGLSGCQKGADSYEGADRIPVSGKVTMDGAPMQSGTITFTPANSSDKDTRPFGDQITNGQYNIPEQKGGNEGTYTVKITWMKPTGKQKKDEDTGEMKEIVEELTAVSYNGSPTAEVKLAPDSNVFDFDAKSK